MNNSKLANNSTHSDGAVNSNLDVGISYSTIFRADHKNSNNGYRKMKRAPKLTQKHKDLRFKFA